MSESYGFRTAVGGFHKGDVTDYIAKTSADHLLQLEELQRQIGALETENQQLRTQLAALSADREPEKDAPVQVPPAEAAPDQALQDRELAAYRRAEAAERLASQRAKQLYVQMEAICDRSSTSLHGAEQAAQEAAAGIEAQLTALMAHISQLQSTLQASAQELCTMGKMVPDPAEPLD